MVMNGYDTDGDGEQQLLHRQWALVLLRALSDSRSAVANGPHLPREPDRVRPDQLVPPPRRLLPLLPDGLERRVRVHGHGHALPGTARDHRDRLREHGPVHVPRAPVRVHRARLDGLLRGRRLVEGARRASRGDGLWRAWAVLPVLLLRNRRRAVRDERRRRSSTWSGGTHHRSDEFDIRRVEFKPGEIKIRVTNPQRDDLTIASVTVDDAIVPFSVDGDSKLGRLRSATIVVPYAWVEDDPDLRGRHELDRDRDDGGDRRCGRDAGTRVPKASSVTA